MDFHTDLTKYNDAGIDAWVKTLDGQEWVFALATVSDPEVQDEEFTIAVGFGEPENIEDFPELLYYDSSLISFWFDDLSEAISMIGKNIYDDCKLVGFQGANDD
jgi:hypothetical protein